MGCGPTRPMGRPRRRRPGQPASKPPVRRRRKRAQTIEVDGLEQWLRPVLDALQPEFVRRLEAVIVREARRLSRGGLSQNRTRRR